MSLKHRGTRRAQGASTIPVRDYSSQKPPIGVHKALRCPKTKNATCLGCEIMNEGPPTNPPHNLHSILVDFLHAPQWSFRRNRVSAVGRRLARRINQIFHMASVHHQVGG